MKKNIVFYVSLLITAIIVVIGLIAPGPFAQAMNSNFFSRYIWLVLFNCYVCICRFLVTYCFQSFW